MLLWWNPLREGTGQLFASVNVLSTLQLGFIDEETEAQRGDVLALGGLANWQG